MARTKACFEIAQINGICPVQSGPVRHQEAPSGLATGSSRYAEFSTPAGPVEQGRFRSFLRHRFQWSSSSTRSRSGSGTLPWLDGSFQAFRQIHATGQDLTFNLFIESGHSRCPMPPPTRSSSTPPWFAGCHQRLGAALSARRSGRTNSHGKQDRQFRERAQASTQWLGLNAPKMSRLRNRKDKSSSPPPRLTCMRGPDRAAIGKFCGCRRLLQATTVSENLPAAPVATINTLRTGRSHILADQPGTVGRRPYLKRCAR